MVPLSARPRPQLSSREALPPGTGPSRSISVYQHPLDNEYSAVVTKKYTRAHSSAAGGKGCCSDRKWAKGGRHGTSGICRSGHVVARNRGCLCTKCVGRTAG